VQGIAQNTIMRTVYLNGEYLLETEAKVSIFDRGFQFSDSVYEVVSILDGKLVDFDRHVERLARSMALLNMRQVPDRDILLTMHCELVARNGVAEGLVYMQVTRGNPGDRDFAAPPLDTIPTITAFTQTVSLVDRPEAGTGISVVTLPDKRWGMAHIKTTQLLYASLMKMEAKACGADDAWLVRDGFVTEGTSQNAHILTQDGVLVTHPLDNEALHGITQAALKELGAREGVAIEERRFSVEEAKAAKEAMNSAASAFIMPVTRIDGVQIGDGKPGLITRQLRNIYIEFARSSAI
jgi:D-alanine transaminase